MMKGSEEEKLELAFRMYDRDHDGKITMKDVERMVNGVNRILEEKMNLLKFQDLLEFLFEKMFDNDPLSSIDVHKFKSVALQNLTFIKSLGLLSHSSSSSSSSASTSSFSANNNNLDTNNTTISNNTKEEKINNEKIEEKGDGGMENEEHDKEQDTVVNKPKSLVIGFGHRDWILVQYILLGIGKSVAEITAHPPKYPPTESDFTQSIEFGNSSHLSFIS